MVWGIRGNIMPNYEALYLNLFNDVTDTIERLKQAQQKAEQDYIGGELLTNRIMERQDEEYPNA